jgi:hypothetical protein
MLYYVTINHAFDKENYLNDLFKLDSRQTPNRAPFSFFTKMGAVVGSGGLRLQNATHLKVTHWTFVWIKPKHK